MVDIINSGGQTIEQSIKEQEAKEFGKLKDNTNVKDIIDALKYEHKSNKNIILNKIVNNATKQSLGEGIQNIEKITISGGMGFNSLKNAIVSAYGNDIIEVSKNIDKCIEERGLKQNNIIKNQNLNTFCQLIGKTDDNFKKIFKGFSGDIDTAKQKAKEAVQTDIANTLSNELNQLGIAYPPTVIIGNDNKINSITVSGEPIKTLVDTNTGKFKGDVPIQDAIENFKKLTGQKLDEELKSNLEQYLNLDSKGKVIGFKPSALNNLAGFNKICNQDQNQQKIQELAQAAEKEKEAKQKLDKAKEGIANSLKGLGLKGEDFDPEKVADKLTKNKDLKGLKDVQENLNNLTDMMGFVDKPNGFDQNNIYAQQITNLDARAYISTDAGKEFIKNQVKDDLNKGLVLSTLSSEDRDITTQTQNYLQEQIKQNIKIDGVDENNITIGSTKLNEVDNINVTLMGNTEIEGQKVENQTTMDLLNDNLKKINTAIETVNDQINKINDNKDLNKDDIEKAVAGFNQENKPYTITYNNDQVKITYNNIDLLEPDTFTNSINAISTNLDKGIEQQQKAREKAEKEAKEKAENELNNAKEKAKATLTAINNGPISQDQSDGIDGITDIKQLNILNKNLSSLNSSLDDTKNYNNNRNNSDIQAQLNDTNTNLSKQINGHIGNIREAANKLPQGDKNHDVGKLKTNSDLFDVTAKIHIASEIAKLTNEKDSPMANISGLKIGEQDITGVGINPSNIDLSKGKTKIFGNQISLAEIKENIGKINDSLKTGNQLLEVFNKKLAEELGANPNNKESIITQAFNSFSSEQQKYLNIDTDGKATFKDIDILQPDEFINGIAKAQTKFAELEKEQEAQRKAEQEAKEKEQNAKRTERQNRKAQTQDSLDNFEPSLFDEPEKPIQENTIELDQVDNLETGKGPEEDGPYVVSKTSPDQTIKFIKEAEENFDPNQKGEQYQKIGAKNSIACGLKRENGKDTVIIKKEIWDKLMPENLNTKELEARKDELKNAINGKDEHGNKVGDPQQLLDNLMVKYDDQSFQLGPVVDKDGKETETKGLTGYDKGGEGKGNFQEQGEKAKKEENIIDLDEKGEKEKVGDNKSTADVSDLEDKTQASEIDNQELDEFDIFIDNSKVTKDTNLIKNNEKKQNAKDDFELGGKRADNKQNNDKTYSNDNLTKEEIIKRLKEPVKKAAKAEGEIMREKGVKDIDNADIGSVKKTAAISEDKQKEQNPGQGVGG